MSSMSKIKLKANDRIIFGNSSAFLFRNEDKASESELQDTKENPVTFEFAMNEKSANDDKEEAKRREDEKKAMEEETAKKLEELVKKQQAEKEEQDKLRD